MRNAINKLRLCNSSQWQEVIVEVMPTNVKIIDQKVRHKYCMYVYILVFFTADPRRRSRAQSKSHVFSRPRPRQEVKQYLTI